jgi:hypothetical protein
MASVAAGLLALRGKANATGCAFAPLVVMSLLVVASREERRRAARAVRGLWQSLEAVATGGRTPWAAAVVFVALPATWLYLSNNRVEAIGDTSMVIPTAVSLLTEGNTDLDEFHRPEFWWYHATDDARHDGVSYFVRRRGGHLYASHPVGLVPLALPVVAASRLMGGRVSEPMVQLRLEKLTAAALAGVSLGLFFLLALHLARPVPALVTTGVLAVASGMFTTVGQNLWAHDGLILGSLLVLLIEFRGPGWRATALQGLICGTMPALRPTAVSVLLPFGLWLAWRSPRRAAAVAGLGAVALAPWAAYHMLIYGSLLGPSAVHAAGANWSPGAVSRLAGVLVSPGRGLLVYQPWVVLAGLALVPSLRRHAARLAGESSSPAGWVWVCLAAVALDVAIVSAWHVWWGGWCWGSRLVVGIVPLCALLCVRPVAALMEKTPGRVAILSLALLGAVVQWPAVYRGALPWNVRHARTLEADVWSWREAPFLGPVAPSLGATRD